MATLPTIDLKVLERQLAAAMRLPLHIVAAAELGASSRASPWRIDVDVAGRPTSYLLRYGESASRSEVAALQAMADHPIPTPQVLHWDEMSDDLGCAVFVSEFIDGDPLLPLMTAGDAWAIDLYIEIACALQAIRGEDLPEGAAELLGEGQSIRDLVDAAYNRFSDPEPLVEAAYLRLKDFPPGLPDPAFSNGDLWPENLLVADRRLVGVIDWQHAGWSDPIFEFLLPFFLVPELRNRGIEEEYCARQGYDASLLHWYHGVEYFDSLSLVLRTGQPYEMHTADSLRRDLAAWLSG